MPQNHKEEGFVAFHRLVFLEGTDFDFFSEETADNFGAHCQHCHWCFTRWKDYVIPGFVESELQLDGWRSELVWKFG